MLRISLVFALRDSRTVSRKAVYSLIWVLHAVLWSSISSLSWIFAADWSAAGSGSSSGGIFVLGGSVGAVVGIKVDVCASAGAASASVIVQGGIFVVIAVPIAWNATNTLYELA